MQNLILPIHITKEKRILYIVILSIIYESNKIYIFILPHNMSNAILNKNKKQKKIYLCQVNKKIQKQKFVTTQP